MKRNPLVPADSSAPPQSTQSHSEALHSTPLQALPVQTQVRDGIGAPASFLHQVVRTGSLLPSSDSLHSPLPCRRGFCAGRLRIEREGDVIHWRCVECGDAGAVDQWRGTRLDGSAAVTLCVDPSPVQVRVTADEYEALRSLQMIDLETQRVLFTAEWRGDEVLLSGPAVDLQSLDDSLLVELNLLRSKPDLRLVSVHQRIVHGLASLAGPQTP